MSTSPRSGPIDVLLLGSTGRVGQAARTQFERSDADVTVRTIGRYSTADHDRFESELVDALAGVDVVVNLAGVAHLADEPSAADLDRLTAANVNLPLLLARRSVDCGVAMIHVSSSKADTPTNAYGWSKALCDAALESSFGPAFSSAGLPLVILKPPALLIPPFDAGRLSSLRWIDRVPKRLLPRRTMPVLASGRFTNTIDHWVRRCARPGEDGSPRAGVHAVRWSEDELDDLHGIHHAMRDARQNRER